MRRAWRVAVWLMVITAGAMACGRDTSPGAGGASQAPAARPVAASQPHRTALSQEGTVTQKIATAHVSISYSRPVARGRVLFGGVVGFGRPWTPGANNATRIEVSRDVQVNGQLLPAGMYTIWAIPDPKLWTMIFSTAADALHEPYPGEEKDAFRLMVSPERGFHMETLTFYFPVVDGPRAELRLHWGEVMIPLKIEVPAATTEVAVR